jgi:hypothetical protein
MVVVVALSLVAGVWRLAVLTAFGRVFVWGDPRRLLAERAARNRIDETSAAVWSWVRPGKMNGEKQARLGTERDKLRGGC